jgi:eukaryotic-like serine/threonine-protein kinase
MKPLPTQPPPPNAPAGKGKPPLPRRGERSGVMRAAPGTLVLEPGAVIAQKYRLERKLSQGGMGSVWAGTHLTLATPVAIKFMTVGLVADPNATPEARAAALVEGRARFEREARAAAQIRMANVVQILDYGLDNHVPYIVMELLEGEDLEARLMRSQRLTPAEVTRILVPIARALQRAHELGLVHRDLKPANIFLAREGDDEVPKILDFGVAKALAVGDNRPSEVTTEGIVLGTPYYMSPEQALNHEIDARSDLWSLGVILFRVLTGTRPFAGSSALETVLKICTGPIPKATAANPELPPEVDAFFARALVRDREKRFQTARDMSLAFAQRFRGPHTSWPPSAPLLGEAAPRAESGSTARIEAQRPVEAPIEPAVPVGSEPSGQGHELEAAHVAAARTRRKRLTIAVAGGLSALVALLALAAIFGGSPEQAAADPSAQPIASRAPALAPGPAARVKPEPPPVATAPSPAASAGAAPSATAAAPERSATRSSKRTTARPSAAKPKRKSGRDLGY